MLAVRTALLCKATLPFPSDALVAPSIPEYLLTNISIKLHFGWRVSAYGGIDPKPLQCAESIIASDETSRPGKQDLRASDGSIAFINQTEK